MVPERIDREKRPFKITEEENRTFIPDSHNLNYKTSHCECAHTIDIINGLMFIFATQAAFSYMFILRIVNITAFPYSYVLLGPEFGELILSCL